MSAKKNHTVVAAVLLCSIFGLAQQILLPPAEKIGGAYFTKWAEGRVILYRDVSDSGLPAVRVFSSNGTNIAIFPMKDVQGVQYVDIWDVSGGPHGETVIAAILGYGPRKTKPSLKSVLMTYDAGGRLTKLWDVRPYHYHDVAVAPDGSVFGLGEGDTTSGDYPLLIKYSAGGKVLGGYLPSSSFAAGDAVINSGSPNGESQMFFDGQQLYVWIAPTRDLFHFDPDGRTQSHISLTSAYQRIEADNDGARLQLLTLGVGPGNELVAQARLWPRDQTEPTSMGMVHLSTDGSSGSFVGFPHGDVPEHFLGTTNDQRMVFLEVKNRGLDGIVRIK